MNLSLEYDQDNVKRTCHVKGHFVRKLSSVHAPKHKGQIAQLGHYSGRYFTCAVAATTVV